MCDEVVVECASLRYGRTGPEEGFVEKYSQSFGDAERAAMVFHRMTQADNWKTIIDLEIHGKDCKSEQDAQQRSETSVKWLMVEVGSAWRMTFGC